MFLHRVQFRLLYHNDKHIAVDTLLQAYRIGKAVQAGFRFGQSAGVEAPRGVSCQKNSQIPRHRPLKYYYGL